MGSCFKVILNIVRGFSVLCLVCGILSSLSLNGLLNIIWTFIEAYKSKDYVKTAKTHTENAGPWAYGFAAFHLGGEAVVLLANYLLSIIEKKQREDDKDYAEMLQNVKSLEKIRKKKEKNSEDEKKQKEEERKIAEDAQWKKDQEEKTQQIIRQEQETVEILKESLRLRNKEMDDQQRQLYEREKKKCIREKEISKKQEEINVRRKDITERMNKLVDQEQKLFEREFYLKIKKAKLATLAKELISILSNEEPAATLGRLEEISKELGNAGMSSPSREEDHELAHENNPDCKDVLEEIMNQLPEA